MSQTLNEQPELQSRLHDAFWRYMALVDDDGRARQDDKEDYGDLLHTIKVGETVKPIWDSTDAIWFMSAIAEVKPGISREWLNRNF